MKRVAQDYRDVTNEKTCVQSTTVDRRKQGYLLCWERNTSRTRMVQTHRAYPPVQFIECLQLVGAYVSVTHAQTLYNAPLSLSLQLLTNTLSLCVSVCLALSLPPTTHRMLYKSYINASSTPFRWTSQSHLFRTPLYKSNIFTWNCDRFVLHNLLYINQY